MPAETVELTEQHREAARDLVVDAARSIDLQLVVELLAEHGFIDDADDTLAKAIHDAAMQATVTVDLDEPAELDTQYAVRAGGHVGVDLLDTLAEALEFARMWPGHPGIVVRTVTYGPWREVTPWENQQATDCTGPVR